MKTRIETIYRCEYCGKHRHRKFSMVTHEEVCTLNPNRICALCDNKKPVEKIDIGDIEIPDSLTPFDDKAYTAEVDDLISQQGYLPAHDCPFCKLAILRQSGVDMSAYQFNLKEEIDEWWREDAY